ncbi:hypothetical protein MTO96_009957 [Rhipicephalus appendiculatus]
MAAVGERLPDDSKRDERLRVAITAICPRNTRTRGVRAAGVVPTWRGQGDIEAGWTQMAAAATGLLGAAPLVRACTAPCLLGQDGAEVPVYACVHRHTGCAVGAATTGGVQSWAVAVGATTTPSKPGLGKGRASSSRPSLTADRRAPAAHVLEVAADGS